MYFPCFEIDSLLEVYLEIHEFLMCRVDGDVHLPAKTSLLVLLQSLEGKVFCGQMKTTSDDVLPIERLLNWDRESLLAVSLYRGKKVSKPLINSLI